MEKCYGLTSNEMEIMEFFWARNTNLTYKEILDYCNRNCERVWKKQTLSTYLVQLQKTGLISVVDTTQRNFVYYPLCSKDEHIHRWTQQLVEKSFDNSVSSFVAAFAGDHKLSQSEAEKLKLLIDDSWASDDEK